MRVNNFELYSNLIQILLRLRILKTWQRSNDMEELVNRVLNEICIIHDSLDRQ